MTISAPCPLCGLVTSHLHAHSEDVEYGTSSERFDFLTCIACDVIFVHPLKANALSEIYPRNYYSFASSARSNITKIKEWMDRRSFRRWLAELSTTQDLSVLDIGGGDGWLIDQLKLSGLSIGDATVVDIDSGIEERAVEKGHMFHFGPIETYVGSTDSMDVVLMLNLIEHVADPLAVLQAAQRLLKSTGRLIIKTPNTDALDARLFRHSNWGGYHTPRHFVLFNKPSFERLLEKAKLDVVCFEYTQGAPFWAVALTNKMANLGWISLDRNTGIHTHWVYKLNSIIFAIFDLFRKPFFKTSQMVFICTPSDKM